MPKRSPKTLKPRHDPSDADTVDDGLAVKIGRLLVRFMSQAAPIDEPESPPRRRAPPVNPIPNKRSAPREPPPDQKAPVRRTSPAAPRLVNPNSSAPAAPSKPGAFGLPRTRGSQPASGGSIPSAAPTPTNPAKGRGPGEDDPHPNPLPAGRGDRVTSPARREEGRPRTVGRDP